VAGPIASGATYTIGDVTGQITAAAGSTVSGSASVDVQAGAAVGTARDPDADNNTASASITVSAGSDLAITVIRSEGTPYFVDGTFDVVLMPSFTGDGPSGLTIVDTLPAQYAIRSGDFAASQSGWSCAAAGQVVTCTRASGDAAGTNVLLGQIRIPITIVATGSGVINRATIRATSPVDPNSANNSDDDGAATLQAPVADLSISKTGPNPALVVIGQSFDYTLRARNNGPSPFSGDLVITDTLPAGLTLTGVTPNGWTCSPAAPLGGPAELTCRRT
jgi:uncharacterized repeat protein (TIGR01451 family)